MNHNDFISPNLLLSEILVEVGDEKLRMGYTKGWYINRIENALSELAFDTYFDKRILDFKIPQDTEKLHITLPEDLFNIREVFVWSGECCSESTRFYKVWYKRLDTNLGSSTSNSDPDIVTISEPLNVLGYSTTRYATIQNGVLKLSSSCSSYTNVRLYYNGIGGKIGDQPIIPRYFRQAITDFVCLKFYASMKNKDNKYRTAYTDKYNEMYNNNNGSWVNAERRSKRLDTWSENDLKNYMSKLNY